jgi:hypothetical protein
MNEDNEDQPEFTSFNFSQKGFTIAVRVTQTIGDSTITRETMIDFHEEPNTSLNLVSLTKELLKILENPCGD